jgi:hypothetical protein
MDYYEVAKKYQPASIRTLLVGETPPPSGKYFYLPMPMYPARPIETDSSLPATIFHHYFGTRPQNVDEYHHYLVALQTAGIFLIDILDEPLKIRDRSFPNGIHPENLAQVIAAIPHLQNKIQAREIDIAERNMVFLLARKHYRTHLRQAFPAAQYWTWKAFRMREVDCVCCRQ